MDRITLPSKNIKQVPSWELDVIAKAKVKRLKRLQKVQKIAGLEISIVSADKPKQGTTSINVGSTTTLTY